MNNGQGLYMSKQVNNEQGLYMSKGIKTSKVYQNESLQNDYTNSFVVTTAV